MLYELVSQILKRHLFQVEQRGNLRILIKNKL